MACSIGKVYGASWIHQCNVMNKKKTMRFRCNVVATVALKDQYRTLRINPRASVSEVKKSFRQLALQYHPHICMQIKQFCMVVVVVLMEKVHSILVLVVVERSSGSGLGMHSDGGGGVGPKMCHPLYLLPPVHWRGSLHFCLHLHFQTSLFQLHPLRHSSCLQTPLHQLPLRLLLDAYIKRVLPYVLAMWHLASVLSVFEPVYGLAAMKRSNKLLKGNKKVAMTLVISYLLICMAIGIVFRSAVIQGGKDHGVLFRLLCGGLGIMAEEDGYISENTEIYGLPMERRHWEEIQAIGSGLIGSVVALDAVGGADSRSSFTRVQVDFPAMIIRNVRILTNTQGSRKEEGKAIYKKEKREDQDLRQTLVEMRQAMEKNTVEEILEVTEVTEVTEKEQMEVDGMEISDPAGEVVLSNGSQTEEHGLDRKDMDKEKKYMSEEREVYGDVDWMVVDGYKDCMGIGRGQSDGESRIEIEKEERAHHRDIGATSLSQVDFGLGLEGPLQDMEKPKPDFQLEKGVEPDQKEVNQELTSSANDQEMRVDIQRAGLCKEPFLQEKEKGCLEGNAEHGSRKEREDLEHVESVEVCSEQLEEAVCSEHKENNRTES
ncbi:hypothetical protein IFM89_015156 [Coptis chinensis]|uniref:J domain-containing protein n=1 Tax=Coptis chinensis TaxID=261450 RepID=A0A835GWJ3_9MAGN|nr:hypothetical protein IFM89_015156 [Coptis chinensis]